MPDIGTFHPIIVHFVVALLFVGVVLRVVSLTGKLSFTKSAATVLILLGTVATILAARSGDDAHGPAERIPGAREAVHEHEEAGERARNVFLLVGTLELAALALAKKNYARWVLTASGVVGLFGLYVVYEAAEHGAEVVYEYAGGVGTRSGNDEDVGRLLVAGLFHQARLDREAGRHEEAARLIEELARRRPDELDVQLLMAQSLIEDRDDGRAALAALEKLSVPPDNRRERLQYGLYTAAAWELIGETDSARVVLGQLQTDFPNSTAIQERLDRLDTPPQ